MIRDYIKEGITIEEFNKAFDTLKTGLNAQDMAKLNLSVASGVNFNNISNGYGNGFHQESEVSNKPSPKQVINSRTLVNSVKSKKTQKKEAPSISISPRTLNQTSVRFFSSSFLL